MIAAPVIKLSSTQLAFCRDEHLYSSFIGGIGSGKSYAGAAKAIMQHAGPGLGLVVAPTYPILRDSTWRSCLEVWDPWLKMANRNEMRIELTTGMEAIFRSADDPDRLRGPNCSWAWIDEGAQCHAGTWPIVIGRLREGGKLGQAWLTGTPRGMNWVYDVFVTGANENTALFQTSTDANPFIDERFAGMLRGQYVSDFAEQEISGKFVTLGAGQIKREWFRIAEEPPAGLRWVRAWDLAASEKTTADYTVGVRAARDADGRLWLADLIRGRWAWPDSRRIILQTMALEPGVDVGVEANGFQLAAFQDLMRQPEAFGRSVRPVAVDKDKLSRAQPWIARAQAGLVTLVRGAWVPDFLSEAENFPAGTHDDMVDATSAACAMLIKPRSPWGAV